MSVSRQGNRQQKFAELIEKSFGGSHVAFFNRTGIATTLVSRYLAGKKGIGDEMADRIERECELPFGWLDGFHSDAVAAQARPPHVATSHLTEEVQALVREYEELSPRWRKEFQHQLMLIQVAAGHEGRGRDEKGETS